jgi:FdhD protein
MTVTDAGASSVAESAERVAVHLGAAEDLSAPAPTLATWSIASERPIAITINGAPWTVLLATPADIENLALGLALTERVVAAATAVQRISVASYLRDISIDMTIAEEQLTTGSIRSRSLAGNSACGLCGIESLADLHRVSETRAQAVGGATGSGAGSDTIADAAILRAFAALPSHQPVNRDTHSVHAAAWCEPDGTIVLAREDVGRHNALDKLVGAMAHRGLLHATGFIVMSSRCSYELVYKAAATSATLLATISAPTSMALEWSRALSLPVVCRIGGPGDGRVVHFARGAADAG